MVTKRVLVTIRWGRPNLVAIQCGDEIQLPSNDQFWFCLPSMDWAHFWSPSRNRQMTTKIFLIIWWWSIFQGDFKVYEFLNASIGFIFKTFSPFKFCVFGCTFTTIPWNPRWVEMVKSFARSYLFCIFWKFWNISNLDL